MSKPIILIDDEEKFARMLHELLQGNGYDSDFCLNPEEALVRIKQENYQLVITDYKMPQMDGAEFLVEARRINPDLPVIMISGLMNMPELIKVANIGVTLVLEKPFNIEDLLESISRFVKPTGHKEASKEAMDMEASEISFQQEKVSVTYPTPTMILSDASNENKRFLETLWQSANNCRHLPFYAQHGAETRLVARELSMWTGQTDDYEPVRIDFIDTDREVTRDWFLKAEGLAGVVMVDLREVDWDAASMAKFTDWIDFVETSGRDLSMLRLVYMLPLGTKFDLAKLGLSEQVKQVFSTDYPVLLSLKDRLKDVAAYINRELETAHKQAIGETGLAQILHYSWPGGYLELKDKLKQVRLRIECGETVDSDLLAVILSGNEKPLPAPDDGYGLGAYLKRRQNEYIQMHRKQYEDLKDTVLRLGVDSDRVSVEDVMQGNELAFPNILKG